MVRKGLVIGAVGIVVLALLAGPYLLMYLTAPERPNVWDYVERRGGAMVVEGPVVMKKAISAISYSSDPELSAAFGILDFVEFWKIQDLWWRNRDKPDWCERIRKEVEEDISLKYFVPQYFFEDDCRFIDEMFSETRSKPHWIGSLALISTAIYEEAGRKAKHGGWPIAIVMLDWREVRGYAADMLDKKEVEAVANDVREFLTSSRVVILIDPTRYQPTPDMLEILERNDIPLMMMYRTGLGSPDDPSQLAGFHRFLNKAFGDTNVKRPWKFIVFLDGKIHYINAKYWEEQTCPYFPGTPCGNTTLTDILAELGYK